MAPFVEIHAQLRRSAINLIANRGVDRAIAGSDARDRGGAHLGEFRHHVERRLLVHDGGQRT
jgi:hypothetical protein